MLEKTIKIDDKITLVLTRMGQCAPAVSDEMQVKGEIRLAACPGGSYLHDELVFEARVNLLGELLVKTWGTPDYHPAAYRAIYDLYTAPTWGAAFSKAEKTLMLEITRLVNALEDRKKALEAAEL